MARTSVLVLFIALFGTPLVGDAAATRPAMAGGAAPILDRRAPCLTEEARVAILGELEASRARLRAEGLLAEPRAGEHVVFGWPLQNLTDDPGVHGISNFVDLDPSYPGDLLDYQCGDRSYDTTGGYNHQGIDFFTWPFGWMKMDLDQVAIVAVANGTIIAKSDGHDDRSCGFGGGSWNAVYVEHADGSIVWYGHMKKNSTTSKGVGETVERGEYLGIVGSSGNSTGPHLHLETYDGSGSLIEPYDGPCNDLNPGDPWWESQRPYHDSAINAIYTQSALPEFPSCPEQEIPNIADTFLPGERVYFAAYYRDQLQDQVSTHRIYEPDGDLFDSWTHASNADHYLASWWAWSTILPVDVEIGIWRFEVEFEGQVVNWPFAVGTVLGLPGQGGVGSGGGQDPSPPADARPRLVSANPIPAGSSSIRITVPEAGPVRVELFTVTGRRESVLLETTLGAGLHDVAWADDAGDGIRFLRITAGGRASVTKVVRGR